MEIKSQLVNAWPMSHGFGHLIETLAQVGPIYASTDQNSFYQKKTKNQQQQQKLIQNWNNSSDKE